jgi:hypothetical protein
MTTDIVRVEIKKSTKGTFDVQIWAIRKYIYIISPDESEDDLYTKRVYPDRDNWIDITLPEKIDGEKRFSVQIWHDGLTWKAVMKNRYNKFRDMMVKGIIPTIYELPVTVY